MYGGHDTADDGCVFVKSLSHGCKAVCRATCGADDCVFSRKSTFVYAVNDCGKVLACRSGNNDFACACIDVSLSLVLAAVETCALEHYVYLQFSPRKVSSLGFGINGDFLSVNGDATGSNNRLSVFCKNGVLVRNGVTHCNVVALSRVILQKVREHLGAGKVVDSNDFVSFSTEHLAECKTTDTSESVDSYSYIFLSHVSIPPKRFSILLFVLALQKQSTVVQYL